MIEIEIADQSCRGCRLCVDICPTQVFVYEERRGTAAAANAEDCIGCLSCAYVCPSGAIAHRDCPTVRNFYRDLDALERLERFL